MEQQRPADAEKTRKAASIEEANRRAYQEALAEECEIIVSKERGSALFRREDQRLQRGGGRERASPA